MTMASEPPSSSSLSSEYSRADRIAFVVLISTAAVLSVIGSSLIIYMVLFRRQRPEHPRQPQQLAQQQQPQRPTYHRLILAISVYTIVQAISNAAGTLAVPKWTGGIGSQGNQDSCTAQGFLVQFSLGELIYNAGLSIYYVAVVRYNMKEHLVVQRLEPFIHVWAFGVSTTLGVTGMMFNVFNPLAIPELGCWISPHPLSCYDDTETCERGKYFQQFSWAFYSQQWLYVVIVIVMSALLYHTVRRQHRSMSLYASSESLQMREKTREVACQAFLFAAACLYVNMWPIIVTTMFQFDIATVVAKIVLYNACFGSTSQGFFNFLIYVRPRYVRMRRRKPGLNRWRVLFDVVRGQESMESQRHLVTATSASYTSSTPLFSRSSLRRMFSSSFNSQPPNSAAGGRDLRQPGAAANAASPAVRASNEVKEEEVAETNSLSDFPEGTTPSMGEMSNP